MPVNFLIIDALRKFHAFYRDQHRVEYPTGSGQTLSLAEVADRLAGRLNGLFLKDGAGRRTIFGDSALFQDDPHFRDNLIFPEYFHGDTGRGLGASQQTGWTALIALLLHGRGQPDAAPPVSPPSANGDHR